MIILPKVTPYKLCTVVREEDNEFIVLQKPTEVIEQSCYFYGGNYKGRIASTEALTGITHKPPIAVNSLERLFFFPSKSVRSNNCIWISHKHVKKVHKASPQKVRISFINNTFMTINVSIRSFKSQFLRTGQLIAAYANNKTIKIPPRQYELVHENELNEYILEGRRKN